MPPLLLAGSGLVLWMVPLGARQDPPTFRTATTLVQFTIVAVDSNGNPVTDLKREEVLHDFTEDVESLRARIARNDIQLQPSTVDRGGDVDGLAKGAVDEKRQIIEEIIASEERMVTPYNQEVRDRRLAMTLGGSRGCLPHPA